MNTERKAMLPHHFADVVKSVANHHIKYSKDPVNFEIPIQLHYKNIEDIIRHNRYSYIKVNVDHQLYSKLGDTVLYTTDILGDEQGDTTYPYGKYAEECNKVVSRLFFGDSDRLVLSLEKDDICALCVHGVHCDTNYVERFKGVLRDNLILDAFVTWSKLADKLSGNTDEVISNANEDREFVWNFKKAVVAMQGFLNVGEVDVSYIGTLISGISFKKDALFKYFKDLNILFMSPCDIIFQFDRKTWDGCASRESRLERLAESGLFDDSMLGEVLDIIELNENFRKKVRSASTSFE